MCKIDIRKKLVAEKIMNIALYIITGFNKKEAILLGLFWCGKTVILFDADFSFQNDVAWWNS